MHSPSGGMSAVDHTRYQTYQEAQRVAQSLVDAIKELKVYNCYGQQFVYPAYWAQCLREEGNAIYIEFG